MVLFVAALLIASPLIGYWIVSSSTVLSPPMGQGEVPIIRDTFVSTVDSLDHSSDLTIRVSNITSGSNEGISIAFIEFELAPPPAGSYLADLVLQLNCTKVVSGGSISFYKCASHMLEENITYDDHPSYDPEPFATTTIIQNGTISTSLRTPNGYTDWGTGGNEVLAITAGNGTDVSFYSPEAGTSFGSRMILYSPVGIPLPENPLFFYQIPLSWIPVTIGFAFVGVVCYESVRSPREVKSTRNSDLA